jgi:hypothetical protein
LAGRFVASGDRIKERIDFFYRYFAPGALTCPSLRHCGPSGNLDSKSQNNNEEANHGWLTLNSPANLPGEKRTVGVNVGFVHKHCVNVGRNIYSGAIKGVSFELHFSNHREAAHLCCVNDRL